MFELLNPLYFIIGGTVGVIVPLVLHLIQSSRTVQIPFSTIRFLKLAQKKSSHRIKMENILLWIIRTLLLTLLALAFAMPMLRSRMLGKFFGRSARDVAIVIDGSYSMDYNLGRTTAWKKAVDNAIVILEGLGEQDRFCIFVARDHVDPLIEQLSGDREEAISRLKALEFSQTSSQLAPAIMDANAALMEAKERREREIHVITDMQGVPWESIRGTRAPGESGPEEPATASADEETPDAEAEGPGAESRAASMSVWDPSRIDERTACLVSLLGADAPENTAPLDVEVDPAITIAGSPSKATVRLGYSGDPRSTAVTLLVDDKEIASRSITLGSEQAGDLVFIVPPLTQGRHAARIEIPDDNLLLDNTFHFILKVEDQFPTLCIGSREDTFFIRAALEAGLGGKAAIEADWVEAEDISIEKLATYACIFVCNAVPLGAAELAELEKFAEAGGLLVVFPGNRGTAADYQPWRSLPSTPTMVQNVPAAERKTMLVWEAPNHTIMYNLVDGAAEPRVSVTQQLVWEKLESRAERLISHGDDYPFLIGHSFGRGYVLMFAVSADRSWSDFPLSPFYLPVVHQIVQFGVGVGSYSHYVWCTGSLPLETHLPTAKAETLLQDPDGKRVPIRSAMVEGRMVLNVEEMTRAGLYQMFDTGSSEPIPALAVNMNRDESDLTPLDPGKIPDLLGIENVSVSFDLEELQAQIQESRVGRTFGEQLLWIALILAAVEFFYANSLLGKGPSLSDKLGLEASGKVSGGD